MEDPIVSHKQWLERRKFGIGSSDAPIIMGASPWSTPYKLWEEKTSRVSRETINFATERGHRLEPKARAAYELQTNIEMPAREMVHKEVTFLRANLDGFNEEENIALEIKCPGKEDHEKALLGQIPAKYMWQLAHQFLVSGADKIHYYSFDGERGVLVEVLPDFEMIAELKQKCFEFWDFVENDVPPMLSDKDYVVLKSKQAIGLFENFKNLKLEEGLLKKKIDYVKNEILSSWDHQRLECVGVRVCRSFRRGNVEYKVIPELKDVDLDQYRKSPSITSSFRVLGDK